MSSLKKIPSPLVSLLPIVLLVGMLFATIHTFGSDALEGGSQISLLTTTAFCVFIGITFYRVPWKDYELAITNNISGVATAIIILLIIGALSGAWMISGIVPTLIYYGMQIIHPDFFLASTCIICALISVMTGSSWTTIATIGIALMGIGKAQGFNEGWIAGAIISGAYFGDKISPLSETTILASSITDVPLFRHIRYYNHSIVDYHTDYLYSNGIRHRNKLYCTHGGLCHITERYLHNHSLVTDCSLGNRNTYCSKSSVHHYLVHIHYAGRYLRHYLPTGFAT